MTWLDRNLEDFNDGKRRNSDIAEHAPTLFSAVWDRVKIIVEEASGKGFNLHPNGTSERRSLEYTAGPTYRPTGMRPEIITMSLSPNRHSLEVSGLKEGPSGRILRGSADSEKATS